MSVYIKGRKPPNSCDDCWVSDCPNDEHIDGYRMMGRPTYCPLFPVHDHGALIEKGATLDACYTHFEDYMNGKIDGKTALLNIEKEIKRAPTIIPADHADKESGE